MNNESPSKPVFVIEPDQRHQAQLTDLLTQWGYKVAGGPCSEETVNTIQSLKPQLVILNADAAAGYTLVGEIRAALPETMIFTTSSPATLLKTMEQLKHLADDFLTLPIAPVALEISLARALRIHELLKEVKSTCSRRRTAQTCENVGREVENERFLAVRQMVEKISAFISEVNIGAQGDLRFYNEVPYFISVHSPDCRVMAANSIYLKYFGNLLYANSWDIYVGTRATRAECPVGRTAATSNVLTSRAVVRYQSGTRVPVLVHTAPIYNNEGEVALVLEVFAGTQEIEQLTRQIRTTHQRYRQLFNAIPSYAVVLDRRQQVTAANRKFTQSFGDHLGHKFFDIFRPAAFPAHREPISQTYRDGLAHQGEMLLTTTDGRTISVMAWTNPILTRSGKMIQVLVIFTDITELRQLKDNLATLGLMVSTVSHDLKSFLTGLDGGLYHIEKGFYRDQPGRIEEGLETTRLMVDRIRKMVLNVLFSCKERPLDRQKIDAALFATEVATVVANRMRGANIDFICDFTACTGSLNVDRDLVRTALVNILENALEACLEDPGPRQYRIEFKALSQPDQVTFLIRDNGPGMTSAQLAQLFTLFCSTKGRGGTGLGMFISQSVIENHHGTIDVQSEKSQGTTFTVKLPRRPGL